MGDPVNLVFSAFAVCFSPMEKDGCPMLNVAKESVLLSFYFFSVASAKTRETGNKISP